MNSNPFRKIPFTHRTSCVICGGKSAAARLELKDFPITEIYTSGSSNRKWGRLNQEFWVCSRCGHGQLACVVDLDLQYGNYHYRSSQSTAGKHSVHFFLDFFKKFIPQKKKLDLIIEIGCNDLYLLKLINARARKLVGIDPILKGRERELAWKNVTAMGGYLEDVPLQGSPDLVLCKDTLEHVAHPRAFLKKIIDQSKAGTLFAFQFPLLDTMIAAGRIDQIFHQHLNYFSLHSIEFMLEDLGCSLVDHTINYNLWGSILIVFRKGAGKKRKKVFPKVTRREIKESVKTFRMNMDITRQRLERLKGQTVYGYGAALMLPILDYYLNGEVGRLKCIMDDDISKKGLRYINLDVDIKPVSEVHDLRDSVVVLTAIASLYNVRSMLAKMARLNPRQIIVPLNTL